jgi:threonine/homoserine/homoserine lactone efflux protein
MTNQVNQKNQTAVEENPKDQELEKYRIRSALTLSIFGISVAAVILIALLVAGLRTAAEISSVVGLFTTTLGTLVGAFFGLQIGSSGKDAAESRADSAQKKVNALQSAADQGMINKAQKLYPDLFK